MLDLNGYMDFYLFLKTSLEKGKVVGKTNGARDVSNARSRCSGGGTAEDPGSTLPCLECSVYQVPLCGFAMYVRALYGFIHLILIRTL